MIKISAYQFHFPKISQIYPDCQFNQTLTPILIVAHVSPLSTRYMFSVPVFAKAPDRQTEYSNHWYMNQTSLFVIRYSLFVIRYSKLVNRQSIFAPKMKKDHDLHS